MILYQDCSSHLDLSKNLAARGQGLFSLYIEKCKKSSCPKPLDQFPYNFAEMFFWWSSTKIVQAVWICQKTWPPGGRAYFPFLCIYIENFKNLLGRNQWTDFNITWKECVFGHPLPRLFKPSWFVKKYGCKGVGLIFPIYLYRKLEKNLLVFPIYLNRKL